MKSGTKFICGREDAERVLHRYGLRLVKGVQGGIDDRLLLIEQAEKGRSSDDVKGTQNEIK